MRNALVALMVLALAGSAFAAGTNPWIGMYLVDNATGHGNNQICPGVSTTFNVYACFDRFGPAGDGVGGGMLGCSFGWTRTFGGFKLSFQNLLGGLMIGDPEVAPGCALTSGANPVFPTAGVVVAATAQFLYMGTPGTMVLTPHGTDGAAVADANNDLDFWCIHSILGDGASGNFGVCVTPPDGVCPPISPVEDSSWGSIKALYR